MNGASSSGITSGEQHLSTNNININNGSSADTNVLLNTLMAQNNMLMELLKLQQNKPANDITIVPDLNKTILVFNGLNSEHQALDCLLLIYIAGLTILNCNRYGQIWKEQLDTGLQQEK